MSNYNYDMKRKIASELIKKAVIIKEAHDEDAIKEIDPQERMSFYAGIQLMYLLQNNKHEAKGMSTDWGSEIDEFKSLMSNILVLLATPGILKRLHKGHRDSAAYKIEKLIDFFTLIDEGLTLEWMDYLKITQTTTPEQLLDQKIKYYTFKNPDTKESNFFSFSYSIHKERYEKMKEIFVSLNSKELLSGK